MLRRIQGDSMLPTLRPGRLVIATSSFHEIIPGKIYIFSHDGLEKIKRAARVDETRVYFLGDNLADSTDSRHFGWVSRDQVKAKLLCAGNGWRRKQAVRQ